VPSLFVFCEGNGKLAPVRSSVRIVQYPALECRRSPASVWTIKSVWFLPGIRCLHSGNSCSLVPRARGSFYKWQKLGMRAAHATFVRYLAGYVPPFHPPRSLGPW